MNRASRVIVTVYSLILAVSSMILLYAYFDKLVLTKVASVFEVIIDDSRWRWILLVFLIVTILSATWSVANVILSSRLGKSRIRSTEIGLVDIGADAIESIALNSAKMTQAGIKSAKARVYAGKQDKIRIHISAVLYANVEIPSMMTRVQERVKKDIERYTGIVVERVSVKVTRVEPVVAKVER